MAARTFRPGDETYVDDWRMALEEDDNPFYYLCLGDECSHVVVLHDLRDHLHSNKHGEALCDDHKADCEGGPNCENTYST